MPPKKQSAASPSLREAAIKLIAYLDDNGELRPSSRDRGWDLVADLRAALGGESDYPEAAE